MIKSKEQRKILITNDDGYEAEGIRLLAEVARRYGQVVVVAPRTEQSAMSQGITVHHPIAIDHLGVGGLGVDTYTITGKPADCVKVALDHLKFKPDLVFSGINNGPNLGTDVLYSGTVGAALEALVYGIPSAAFSCPRGDFGMAQAELGRVLDYLFMKSFWQKGVALNVNFPGWAGGSAPGIRLTKQGHRIIAAEYHPEANEYWQRGRLIQQVNEPDTDVTACEEGFISITPLGVDRTRYDILEQWRRG